MRYTLIFFALLFACSKPEPYQAAITTLFLKSAHDPKSFEYVETSAIDTLTMNDWRRNVIRSASSSLGMDSTWMKHKQSMYDMAVEYNNQDEIPVRYADLEKAANKLAASHSEIDSLTKSLTLPDSNAVKVVNVTCSIRSKNKMGALVLEKYHVQFAPDMTIIDVSGPVD